MSGIKQTTDEIIEKCEKWYRLAILVNNPVKDALLAILHNTVLDPSINGLPDDPTLLYKHIVTNEMKLRNNKLLKQDQLDLLLPHNWKVYSKSFDVTLIRFLIQTFSNIINEDGDWKKPRHDDHSIAAAVFRAADIRNRVFHYKDPKALGDVEFEKMWREIQDILADLRYVEDISEFRENSLDPVLARKLKQIHANNMVEDFENILVAYKDKCKKENKDEWKTFLRRRYKNLSTNHIVTDINAILRDHDSVMVSGPAGLGKTFSAKYFRYSWASDESFGGKKLIYIDSKKVCKKGNKKSYRAPIYISELENMVKDKPDDYLELFNCVTKTIDNLLILIDGVDELPIEDDKLNLKYLKDRKVKIENNEEITSMETILGIYFGIFFPGSKIIAFGRNNEIDRLKKIDDKLEQSNLFKKPTRAVLELQPLEEEDIKELISRVNCGKESCGCEKCTKTYNSVKDVEFRNIPSHLMAMIKIFKYLPNTDFGRITKTKIFIIEIFNLLYKHTQTVSLIEDVTTFEELLKYHDKEFGECIQNIAKISFFSLLDDKVTIKVEGNKKNDVEYFEYKQTFKDRDICVQIKRDILEQLDFFYIRDLKYRNFILEPYHLTNMEFLASCHIYCDPDERTFSLELNEDRQTVILPYVAALYSNDNFTKDFVREVFQNTSNDDVETYLSWLFSVEDVRYDSPFSSWYGLKENGQLFPSFYLLNEINEEVDVSKKISEKLKDVQTLVCYCSNDFEWYHMEMFQHKFLTNDENNYNVKSFMSKFIKYQIIVKIEDIYITNKENFNSLFGNNDKIEFRINYLGFNCSTPHSTQLKKHLKCNSLEMGKDCDSSTIDFLLNATSLSTATTSSRIPSIKCKRLDIRNILHFNDQQIEKLFKLGLSGLVDSISLRSPFFEDGQLAILEGLERKTNKKINIELIYVKFNDMFGLPNLGNRHVSLYHVDFVTNNELIELKKHIPPGYTNKLTNYIKLYKIIDPLVPFVRKENSSRDIEHSIFLSLYKVNFTQVSQDVFAETFSMTPSLSFVDDDDYIPSSLWSRLSRTENGRLNEMRIWDPRLKNLEYFFKLKINILQLIYYHKSDLEQLLTHIVNNINIELNKEIKVFLVRYEFCDWDDYKEITLFSETIEEYRNNNSSYNKLLDNIREGGSHKKWWCCEISLLAEKIADVELQGFSEDDKRCVEETVDKVERKTNDAEIEDN